jgi:hypothetical protein
MAALALTALKSHSTSGSAGAALSEAGSGTNRKPKGIATVSSDLMIDKVIPYVGDPHTVAPVCRTWRAFEKSAACYKGLLEAYLPNPTLASFAATIPKRLSPLPRLKLLWMRNALLREAAILGIAPKDFKNNQIASLNLVRMSVVVEHYARRIVQKLELPKAALNNPVKAIIDYCRHLEKQIDRIDKQQARVGMGSSMIHQERFHELTTEKVHFMERQNALRALVEKCKKEIFAGPISEDAKTT